jgi:Na+/proline symporter
MHFIDWLILLIPMGFVLWLAVHSRKYVRGVADYLAAGRCAGRYVIAVANLETALGIIILISLAESRYQVGFGIFFWEALTMPIGIVVALTGYCVYRFRATRALSIGQFLEMRYSRPFRIFAATVRTAS